MAKTKDPIQADKERKKTKTLLEPAALELFFLNDMNIWRRSRRHRYGGDFHRGGAAGSREVVIP